MIRTRWRLRRLIPTACPMSAWFCSKESTRRALSFTPILRAQRAGNCRPICRRRPFSIGNRCADRFDCAVRSNMSRARKPMPILPAGRGKARLAPGRASNRGPSRADLRLRRLLPNMQRDMALARCQGRPVGRATKLCRSISNSGRKERSGCMTVLCSGGRRNRMLGERSGFIHEKCSRPAQARPVYGGSGSVTVPRLPDKADRVK
jgi:hypothetical protein